MQDENHLLRGGAGECGADLGATLADILRFVVQVPLDEAFDEVEE